MSERSFRRENLRRVEATRRREARRAKKAAATAAAVGAFVLAAPAASSAATFVVNVNTDAAPGTTTCAPDPVDPTSPACDLRDAIAAASTNAGADEITFDSSISGNTITLQNSAALVVNDNDPLTIYGGPSKNSITVDANYNSMVFDVQNTALTPAYDGLTMSGLTAQHGNAAPAGGIYVEQGSQLLLENSTVTGNSAGGAQVDKYSFAAGGGITTGAGAWSTVSGSYVTDNHSEAFGGGGPLDFPFYGGGGVDNLGRTTITGSLVAGNDARMFGGGVFNGFTTYPTQLEISNSTITGNGAPLGGGVSTSDFLFPYGPSGGNLGADRGTITNSTISDNGSYLGGGIGTKYLGGRARWTVSHTTISGNYAIGGGGGLAVGNPNTGPYPSFPQPGSLELVDSTLSGNAATYGGGALVSTGAQKYPDTVQFNNSTIASNHAYGSNNAGGGIYEEYTSPGSYGPYQGRFFDASLFSTIVGDNVDSGGLNDLATGDGSYTGFNLSFSLVRAPGNAQITETPAGSNIIGADPLLGSLGNNGGPTQTQLPSINSPVVDHGSAPGNLTTDQRGLARTVDTGAANAQDGTDIGAVELPTGPPSPPPPSGGPTIKVHGVKKKHKKRRRIIRTKHEFAKIHLTFSTAATDVTFQCSIDAKPYAPCVSPFSARVRSASGDGKKHTIRIRLVDANGNPVGKPRVFTFWVIRKD